MEGDGKQRAGNLETGGGGGGGGVLIQVETLRGGGEINADGGSADSGVGAGCGGGGRIAVYYTSRASFTGSVHAYGGAMVPAATKNTSIGGAGTIYWKSAAQLYGDLVVDAGARIQSTPRTRLRPVGTGTVSSLAPASLVAPGPFVATDTGLQGAWVVLNGAVTQPFRILSNSATEIFTDPASGDMTLVGAPGGGYQGALVLDNLLVTRNGAMTTLGELIIIATGTSTVSLGGSLTAPPVVHW